MCNKRKLSTLALTIGVIVGVSGSHASSADLSRKPTLPFQEWKFRPWGKWDLLSAEDPALVLSCVNNRRCAAAPGDILRAPPGYKICWAQVHRSGLIVGSGATFNATLMNGATELSYYYYGGE